MRRKTTSGRRAPEYEKEDVSNGSSTPSYVGADETSSGRRSGADLKTLDRAFVRGLAWTASVKWLTQLLTWGITIVVARLLIPADYGLLGMATIYIDLFILFSEFGIGTTVVTMQDLSDDQVSQLNTLSLFLGFAGFLISAAVATPLGKFYHAPNLPLVVIVLSGGFIISGLRTVPYSLLQKELRFKLLSIIEGMQGIVQSVLTLVLAFLGFGYWALVLGVLSFSVTSTCLVLIRKRHSFAFPRYASIRKAIHYSRHILIGRLCWASYTDSDFIVAGRVLGEAPLGAYTLAWTLAHAPLEKLTTLVNRVTPSVFARIQTDSDALRRYIRNITGGMALIIFPLTIGIALVAPEFVPFVLGPKWVGVVAPLQLLALHALIRSNVILLTPLLNVVGEERLVMWSSIIGMIVLPVSFYVGSRWGTVGIASGWVLIYPLIQVPLFVRMFRRIKLPRGEYLVALWPAVSGCAAMAISVAALKLILREPRSLPVRLLSEIVAGAITYGLVLILFHRNRLQDFLKVTRAFRSVPTPGSSA
jgi:O-antigen/teichoic acid export membrane protein